MYSTDETNNETNNICIRNELGQWIPAGVDEIIAFNRFSTGIYDPPSNSQFYNSYITGISHYDLDQTRLRTIEEIRVKQKIIHYMQREKLYNYINEDTNSNFTISRNGGSRDHCHGGIIITKIEGNIVPIADWNNIKVFLTDLPNMPVDWYDAYSYQKWAYLDFCYSIDTVRKYKSKNTIGYDDHIEIPLDNIQSDIIFKMIRNDNFTISYERNDINRTRVRISDCNSARLAYTGFYRRMTDDILHIVTPLNVFNINQLQIPQGVIIEKTDNEELMCCICNINKQNIQFMPCNHTSTCSECYTKLQNKNECPLCRTLINSIELYTNILL